MKYKSELMEKLPQMFSEGESVVQVCVKLDITKRTFYDWVDKYPEFRDAYEKGREISEDWWINTGKQGMRGQITSFNAAIWIFNMKNRFEWRDHPKADKSDTVEQLGEALRNVLDS